MSVTTDALRRCAAAIAACADAIDAQATTSEVLDVPQAASVAKCSPRSVRAAIKRGKLEARGHGRHVVIDRAEVERWLRELPPRPVRLETIEHEDEMVDQLAASFRSEAAE